MALAGALEIQISAGIARITDDLAKINSTVGRSMKGVESAVASAKAALGALGIGLGVGYFTTLIKGSIDAMDRLRDLSLTTNITVEHLAGLQLASRQAGGDLDSIAASINKLSVNMGKDAEKFKALGVSAKDPLEAFKQLSDIYVKLEDPQQRAAVMAAALGKSWAGAAPLLAEGSAKIQEMVDKGAQLSGMTKEASEQADKFNDKMAEMNVTLGATRTKLVGDMLPGMNEIALAMQEAAKEGGLLLTIWVGLGGVMANLLGMTEAARTRDRLIEINEQLAIATKQLQAGSLNPAGAAKSFWSFLIPDVKLKDEAVARLRETIDALEAEKLRLTPVTPAGPGGVDPRAAAEAAARAAQFLRDQAAADAAAARAAAVAEKEALNFALAEGAGEEYRIQQEAKALSIEFNKKEEELAALQTAEDLRIQILIDTYDREQQEAIAHGAELIAIDKAISEGKKREKDEQLANAQQFLGNLAGLMNSSSRKAFEVGKVAALAQAGIAGALAVMEAWRAGMSTAGPWAPFVAAAYAAAAAANAINLMNNIRKQQFGGSGGGIASPVFSAQPGTSIPSGGAGQSQRDSQGSQVVVNVNVQGNILGNQQFVDDILLPGIRDAVDNRDFILIGDNSRQAANLAT